MLLEDLLNKALHKAGKGVSKIRNMTDVYVVSSIGILHRQLLNDEDDVPMRTLVQYDDLPLADTLRPTADYSASSLLRTDRVPVQLSSDPALDTIIVDSSTGTWILHDDMTADHVHKDDSCLCVYAGHRVKAYRLKPEYRDLEFPDRPASLAVSPSLGGRPVLLLEGADEELMLMLDVVDARIADSFECDGTRFMLDGYSDSEHTYTRIKEMREKLANPVKDVNLELRDDEKGMLTVEEPKPEREPFEDAADAMYDAGDFSVSPDFEKSDEPVADEKEPEAEPRRTRTPKRPSRIGFDFQPIISYAMNQPDLTGASSEQILAELRGWRDTFQYGARRMYNTAEAAVKSAVDRGELTLLVEGLNKIVHK